MEYWKVFILSFDQVPPQKRIISWSSRRSIVTPTIFVSAAFFLSQSSRFWSLVSKCFYLDQYQLLPFSIRAQPRQMRNHKILLLHRPLCWFLDWMVRQHYLMPQPTTILIYHNPTSDLSYRINHNKSSILSYHIISWHLFYHRTGATSFFDGVIPLLTPHADVLMFHLPLRPATMSEADYTFDYLR